MNKESTPAIVIALCTSAALIGFAFFERHGGEVRVSETALYLVAATICVSPASYHLLRCRLLRSRHG